MEKGRLEAFSDGVIAIIMTIMVLELKSPPSNDIAGLKVIAPVFFSYLLSFAFVGTYWVNHHHMFQAIRHVDGRILWLNINLLFWLSLMPFCMGWLAESGFTTWPVLVYGLDLLAASIAYLSLAKSLVALHGPDSPLALALQKDVKGKISVAIYVLALPLAFIQPKLCVLLFSVVVFMWVVPDPRIEKRLKKD
ncbi:MAG: TMEM175 family protein [candidate division FCPU426 bacterium]